MARRISEISAELASWSLNYASRDCDIYGHARHGVFEDRAAALADAVQRLDRVADMLCNLPRIS